MRRELGWGLIACVAVAGLGLGGCGGGGTTFGAGGTLYVTAGDGVAIYHRAAALSGEIAPNRYLAGTATGLQFPTTCSNHVVTSDNDLYVGDDLANAVFVFNPASSVDNNTAPTRTLEGIAVPITSPRGIVVDTDRDILYVANLGDGTVYVWDNAATVDDNAAPDRAITGVTSCRDLALDDDNDRLYVCVGDEIWVLNNASTLDGAATPDRNINGVATQLDNAYGIELDLNRDRLYVANRNGNSILAFDDVDTADDNVAPRNVLTGPVTTPALPDPRASGCGIRPASPTRTYRPTG